MKKFECELCGWTVKDESAPETVDNSEANAVGHIAVDVLDKSWIATGKMVSNLLATELDDRQKSIIDEYLQSALQIIAVSATLTKGVKAMRGLSSGPVN